MWLIIRGYTTRFVASTPVAALKHQVRAGGRIPLIIGRGLTNRAREAMSLGPTTTFKQMAQPEVNVKGFSLAQKMVGKAPGGGG